MSREDKIKDHLMQLAIQTEVVLDKAKNATKTNVFRKKSDGQKSVAALPGNLNEGQYKDAYAKGLAILSNDDLFLMSQLPRPILKETMTGYTGPGKVTDAFNEAYNQALATRRTALEDQLGKLGNIDYKNVEHQKIILGLLFVREWNIPHYQEPENNELKALVKEEKIQNLPREIFDYLSAIDEKQRKTLYGPLIQSHTENLLSPGPGSAPAAAASSNKPAPKAELIKLSRTITGTRADAIDSEIIGAVLGNPQLGTKDLILPNASGDPATIKVYGGIIRFENNEITKGEGLAIDHGEVELGKQITELLALQNEKNSITVDFVVAEGGRNHFSILSVTSDPGKKIKIEHRDTSRPKNLPKNSLQKKLEEAVKEVVFKVQSNPGRDQLPYQYVATPHQQRKNTCADRVMLSMLLTHDPGRLTGLLNNFSKELTKAAKTIEAQVDHLLNPDNEALLRKFTCFLVEKTSALERKIEITEVAPPAEASFLRGRDTWYPKDSEGESEIASTEEDRKKWLLNSLGQLNKNEKKNFAEGTRFAWKQDANGQFNEPSVQFDDDQKLATISLTMTRPDKTQVDITLTRKEEEIEIDNTKTPVVTWKCDASGLSEKEKFELIAVESLALRQAQKLSDADKIGIVELDEATRGKQNIEIKNAFRFTPNNKDTGNQKLSQTEVNLIKAHLDAGYNEVTYRDITFTGLKPLVSSVSYLTSNVSGSGSAAAAAAADSRTSKKSGTTPPRYN